MLVIRLPFKIVCFVVLLVQFSCQEIPYNLNEPATIFVSSSFQNNKTTYFGIYYTRLPGEHNAVPVANAHINLFENNELVMGFNQVQNGLYENKNHTAIPGSNYNIVIDVPGFEPFKCKFTMPKIVSWQVLNHWIDSVVVTHYDAYIDSMQITDTSYFITEYEAYTDTITYCRIKFKVNDPENENNYYGISISKCYMYFTESKQPNFEGTLINADNFYYAPFFDDKHYADEQQTITINYVNASDTTFFEFYNMDERQFENTLRSKRYHNAYNTYDESLAPAIDIFKVDGIPENEPVIFDHIAQGGFANISYISYYYDTIIINRPPENEWIIRKGGDFK